MEKAKKETLNGFGTFSLHLVRLHYMTEDLCKQAWGGGADWHSTLMD